MSVLYGAFGSASVYVESRWNVGDDEREVGVRAFFTIQGSTVELDGDVEMLDGGVWIDVPPADRDRIIEHLEERACEEAGERADADADYEVDFDERSCA